MGLIEYTRKDGTKGEIEASKIDHITTWQDGHGGIHTKEGDAINVIDAFKVIQRWEQSR